MPGSHLSWCSCVPRCSTAQPNRPHWTPALICSDGSAMTSSSKLAMDAAVVVLPAQARGEGPVHGLGVDQFVQLGEDAFAVLVHAQARDAAHGLGACKGAGFGADGRPAAEQLFAEGRDVDGGVGGVKGHLFLGHWRICLSVVLPSRCGETVFGSIGVVLQRCGAVAGGKPW